jgi:hypothetical protein
MAYTPLVVLCLFSSFLPKGTKIRMEVKKDKVKTPKFSLPLDQYPSEGLPCPQKDYYENDLAVNDSIIKLFMDSIKIKSAKSPTPHTTQTRPAPLFKQKKPEELIGKVISKPTSMPAIVKISTGEEYNVNNVPKKCKIGECIIFVKDSSAICTCKDKIACPPSS